MVSFPSRRTELYEPLDFQLTIVGFEIDMRAVLDGLWLPHSDAEAGAVSVVRWRRGARSTHY